MTKNARVTIATHNDPSHPSSSAPKPHRALQCITWVILVALAGLIHYSNIRQGIPNHGSDFEQDYVLSVSAAGNEDPYLFLRNHSAVDRPVPVRVNHPPGVGILLYPFSYLTLDQAYIAFCLTSLVLFVCSLVLLGNELQLSLPAKISLAVLGLGWWPTIFGVRMGSLSLVLAALMIGGWVFARRGSAWRSGACFALAIHLKLFPALLALHFLASRAWSQLAWTIVWTILIGIATTTVFGVGVWVDFFHVATLYREHAAGALFNISLYGLGELLFGDLSSLIRPVFDLPGRAKYFGMATSCLALAITGYHWFCQPRSPKNYMLTLCLMILVTPASWSHTIAILALPMAFCLTYNVGRVWVLVVIFTLLSFPDLAFERIIEGPLELRPPWHTWVGVAFRLPTAGVLALFVLLVLERPRQLSSPEDNPNIPG